MIQRVEIPDFNSVTLGGNPTTRPDIAEKVLYGVMLQIEGTGSPTVAEYLTQLRLLVNGKQKMLFKPTVSAKLNNILNSNGDTLDDTMFWIPLGREGIPGSPWGTADINKFVIEASIAAANPSGKTLTRLKGWLYYVPMVNPPKRGDVILQTIITPKVPIAGWNTLDDLELGEIRFALKAILNADPITEVEVKIGDRPVYHVTKALAKEELARAKQYKLPSTVDFFPVLLELVENDPSQWADLMENEIRRPLSIRYYWDTGVGAVAAFDILLEGVEKGVTSPVAVAKA